MSLCRIWRLGAVAVLSLLVACIGDVNAPYPEKPDSMSMVAFEHLNEALSVFELTSIKRRTLDWRSIRAEAIRTVATAQTPQETYAGIRRAMQLVGDGHSSYTPLGGALFNVPNRTCTAPTIGTPPALPANIGYVRVRSTSTQGSEAIAFAQALTDSLRVRDVPSVIGWIVDLRNNGGGNMYPMVAGIGSLFAADTLGWFIDANGARIPWRFRNGGALYGASELVRVATPFVPTSASRPIAVLIDNRTASSGEATAISLQARPVTRFFGTPSCGVSTGNVARTMRNGDLFVITQSIMADRNGRAFGDQIVPDEVISVEADLFARAVQWLQAQP